MLKKDKRFIVISLLVLVFLSYLYISKKMEEKETKKEELTINELTPKQQEEVANYVEENLSEISPKKETLGGTFYLIGYDFENGENMIIEYEDGHVILRARVNFEYIDSENINIKEVKILN
jgi:hypothetical protein